MWCCDDEPGRGLQGPATLVSPMANPSPAPQSFLGTVLASRYELRAMIGRGGMGEVYEAVDRSLGRTVAVKVLRPDLAHDGRFPPRLRREARTVAGLAHPGIVAVHDVGEQDGLVFIVMEMVAGRTLDELIAVEGRLDTISAARIGAGVAQALAHAHSRGVVHRDISPGNVMVTDAGEVKVLDFGIARAARGSSRPRTGSGGSGSARGTTAYTAPERMRGDVADHRSDIYGLGAVMFELVTGTLPMADEVPDDLPPRLAMTLRRCLCHEPDARFTSAGELAEELWKVALAAPAGSVVHPESASRNAGEPGLTEPLPRTHTALLPVPSDQLFASADSPPSRRGTRSRRVLAGIAGVVLTAAAAAIAVPTLASVNGSVTPTVRGPRPVPAPADLTATASCDGFFSTGVDLAWSADGRSEGFEIWRRAGSDRSTAKKIARVGADERSYRDVDLGIDTAYVYSVRAVDGPRVSHRSNRAEVDTPLLCLS
jgi:serine/threonine protein kinase